LLVEVDPIKPLVGGESSGAHISGGGAKVVGGSSRWIVGTRAHVPDPIGVRIPDGAPVGGAAVGTQEQDNVGRPSDEKEIMHLVEQKVYAVLNDEGDKDPRRWVLDIGASNHMMGSRVAFASIDTRTAGMVRFGDGSVVRIKGRGTILYQCKNGEHRALLNVYYIPRLDNNIINIGQFDESDYEVKIHHGVMQIHADDGLLLAKIQRGPTWLYMLELHIA
jgi:hypothetical protein